jgi:hypothetical protein
LSVHERLAAGGGKRRLRDRVGLQVQAIQRDQREEQIAAVQPVAAEHAPRTHCAERCEQLQAVFDQGGAHAASLGGHNARFNARAARHDA